MKTLITTTPLSGDLSGSLPLAWDTFRKRVISVFLRQLRVNHRSSTDSRVIKLHQVLENSRLREGESYWTQLHIGFKLWSMVSRTYNTWTFWPRQKDSKFGTEIRLLGTSGSSVAYTGTKMSRILDIHTQGLLRVKASNGDPGLSLKRCYVDSYWSPNTPIGSVSPLTWRQTSCIPHSPTRPYKSWCISRTNRPAVACTKW